MQNSPFFAVSTSVINSKMV